MASMAVSSFSNCISLLLLTTLFMSLQIHARDSQFFSKVTHVTIPATTNNNNNVVKETELPKKEEPVNKPEQEPSFMPETESSYGLYGHESGQFAPTTTTYKPYKTEPEQHTDMYPYSNNNNYHYNNNNYKTDAYGRNQNEFNSMANQNNNHKYDYNNAANDRYNVDRQGMSDTRFMEGGKYFYDVNSEKYDSALYGDSSRGVNTRGWENNRGYFGNNKNAKSYENNNSFEGYQNQEEFENEPEEFEP
ncbi:hypothetical protein K1719_008087 [Acacia pycnantha]|nr:hypothetical protein K1719_008087 [Acacia pycnantha]